MVKFLVVRFSSIGDIILTTPVVRHLKKQVEDAEIHYLTKQSFATLLEANPYIDKVHAYEGDMKAMPAAASGKRALTTSLIFIEIPVPHGSNMA